MRARRRQAQRPRQCRLHRAPSHLLRDARQLLVRRLFQGARDRAGLEADHEGIRAQEGQAARHRLPHRRRGGRALEEDRRLLRRPHHPHPDLGQFLGDGRHRPVRPVLGDLHRSRRPHLGRPSGLAGGGRRPLPRILESRVHAIRAGDERAARGSAASLDRHRHGAGAHGLHHAGRRQRVRDRSVPSSDRRDVVRARQRAERADRRLVPRHRRPSALVGLPGRGWRAALERGPRLCAAPDHAPRDAPCAAARRERAADASPGLGAGPRDGPGLSRPDARGESDRGNAAAGRDPLPQDAGARPRHPRREERVLEEGRHVRRRRRLHAVRHLRLPARPDAGRAEVARHRRRPGLLHRRDGASEGQGARVLEGVWRGGLRGDLVPAARKARGHRISGLRDRERRRRGVRAGEGRPGSREPQGRRHRRAAAEPDAVLCGVRRPGRRHRRADGRGRHQVPRHRHAEEARRFLRSRRHIGERRAEGRHRAAARGRSRQALVDPRASLGDASHSRGAAPGARRSHRPARLDGRAGSPAFRLRASEADHGGRARPRRGHRQRRGAGERRGHDPRHGRGRGPRGRGARAVRREIRRRGSRRLDGSHCARARRQRARLVGRALRRHACAAHRRYRPDHADRRERGRLGRTPYRGADRQLRAKTRQRDHGAGEDCGERAAHLDRRRSRRASPR